VLDLGNPAVLEYLKTSFSEVFDGVPIDYFKWDANRHLSGVGSLILPAERQGEAAYRYMLGVYELYRFFKEHFPKAMIENCSGGGGRYDLGMMKYSTMIWTSDNTSPVSRIKIQYSSMVAYPASTMSCHVSKHKECEDEREMRYRYHVALGGALGYELHLPNASDKLRAAVKKQIEDYRTYEDLILRGEYYSILNPFETECSAYYYTDSAKERFLLSFLQRKPEETSREFVLAIPEADRWATYLDAVSGRRYSGCELAEGIRVTTENISNNSRIWHFIKDGTKK
jgi:alpha-galactosidase